jgi:hypothetical protein
MSTTEVQISAAFSELPLSEKPMRRLKLAEAMRLEGVDETAVAKTYRTLLDRKGPSDTTQDAKLRLETLRDCAEILDPPRSSDEIPENAIVQMIHSVPRPDWNTTAQGKEEGNANG